MLKEGVEDRFRDFLPYYISQNRLSMQKLTEKLGYADSSIKEVRSVVNGTHKSPLTAQTIGKYFAALNFSEEDQRTVFLGLSHSELIHAMQTSADFGHTHTNEPKQIRNLKLLARQARDSGDFEKAMSLSFKIEKFHQGKHFYAKQDLEEAADSRARILAWQGSLALEKLDFKMAFERYRKIPELEGLSQEVLEKYIHAIRIGYNVGIKAENNLVSARELFAEMQKNGVTPDVVSYTTLMTFLNSEDEVRELFAEMQKNGVTPNVFSYTTLMTKCENIERGKLVAKEFQQAFPNTLSTKLSSAFVALAEDFFGAIQATKFLLGERFFVGRGEYEKAFSFSVSKISADKLLGIYFEQEFKFDTSLEGPINLTCAPISLQL